MIIENNQYFSYSYVRGHGPVTSIDQDQVVLFARHKNTTVNLVEIIDQSTLRMMSIRQFPSTRDDLPTGGIAPSTEIQRVYLTQEGGDNDQFHVYGWSGILDAENFELQGRSVNLK